MAIMLLSVRRHKCCDDTPLLLLVGPIGATQNLPETDNPSYYPPTFVDKWANKKTKKQVIQDFDYVGLILFTAGIILFCMGISWGGSYYPWKSAHVIVTIIVGFFTLVVFSLYELYVPLKEPLIPMHLFKNLPWVSDVWMLACGASVYFCFSIVWPLMVFGLYTSDLTKGGLLCCVTGVGTNIGQIISGLTAKNIGHQKYQAIVVTISMGLFLACMSPSFLPWYIPFHLLWLPHQVSRMTFDRARTNDGQAPP
jgi:hypothetical protein